MRFAWLGIWLLLPFCLIGNPLFYQVEHAALDGSWLALAGSVVCFWLDSKPADPDARASRSALASIACAIGAVLAPSRSLCVGLALFAGFGVLHGRGARAARIAHALRLAATILTWFGLLELVAPYVMARLHGVPGLDVAVAALLEAAGTPARAGSALLSIEGVGGAQHVSLSAEKLALLPLVLLSIGVAASAIALSSEPRRVIARALAILCVYALCRVALLACVVADGGRVSLFYEPSPVLLSFVPLTLVWWTFQPARAPFAWREPWSGSRAALTSGVAAVALLALAAVCDDPGSKKAGRILIDEYHSDWEWTGDPLTTEQFGPKSTYNYFCMAEYLRHHYPVVDRNLAPITPELLAGYDVLVLKTPTRKYTRDERSAIDAWVRSGGGAWLVGDHTNVFGMSTCLNEVSAPLGITFQADGLDDMVFHERQVYRRPRLGAHPIVQDVPPLLMATSCSLSVGLATALPMVGHMVFADRADYRIHNFFGDHKQDATEHFGSFVQMAATTAGRGRVACFTDSTVFSNFSFYFPGKAELCIGTIEWLNRKSGSASWPLARVALAAAGLVLLFVSLRARVGAWTHVIAVGAILGLHGADLWNAWAYRRPAPISAPTSIAFVQHPGEYQLPIVHPAHANEPDNLETFFVWTQRLGLVPRVVETIDDVGDAAIVVFARPRSSFRDSDRASIRRYVERGGRVLLLDSGDDAGSTANELLCDYGMEFTGEPGRARVDLQQQVGTHAIEGEFLLDACRFVRGGEPFLRSVDGRVLGARVVVGKGMFAAMGTARSFSSDRLGFVRTLTTDAQRALADVEFHVLREVLGFELTPPHGRMRVRQATD